MRDGDRVVPESSVIVEYLDHRHPGPRALVPSDPDAALEVRLWDRVFDNYVQTPIQEIVTDRLLGANRDLTRAHATLAAAYDGVEKQLGGSTWIVGDNFTLADCAAAPALFYAATLHPFPPAGARLSAYFERLVDRPAVRRTIEEAKPYFKDYPFESQIAARFR